jgi:hypothetical protein
MTYRMRCAVSWKDIWIWRSIPADTVFVFAKIIRSIAHITVFGCGFGYKKEGVFS